MQLMFGGVWGSKVCNKVQVYAQIVEDEGNIGMTLHQVSSVTVRLDYDYECVGP